jgi:ABC-2 type transport system permease protein/sodium transport system permease protein
LLPAGLARLGRLARKELSETLRDRRTIVTLLLMPLLLYPLLGLVLGQFTPGKPTAAAGPRYRLAFRTTKEAARASDRLGKGEAQLVAQGLFLSREGENMPGPQPPPKSALPLPELDVLLTDDLEVEVLRGYADVAFRTDPATPDAVPELLYLEDSATSCEVVRHIQRLYDAARLRALENQPGNWPVRIKVAGLARPGRPTPSAFLVLMPLILILMTITGAVYPAIDLTAGERERGTLEILMAAPVPRLSLLLAKYTAVVTVAVLTALVNLGSMALTLWLSGLGERPEFRIESFSPLVFLEIFLLLLLFAAFFAAVLLALTSFARSFKEAQAYLIPLMLVALVPGVMSLVPGLHLDGPLVLVPLLNIVLLARDLLLGEASLFAALFVILSTLAYALVAIVIAALIFGAEAVRSGQGGWWGRRRAEPV